MVDLVLFPSSYFSAKRIDEDLKKEFEAVNSTGLFDTILFSYDKWYNEDRLILSETPTVPHTAIMRGWMMKPEKYRLFYKELLNRNIQLITTPEEYELMHIFPNVYNLFENDTAKIMTFPLHEQIDIEAVKKSFNRFMVKDFVKSVKGTAFPKFFDASVTQEEFDKYMEMFYKYRGNLLTGGICIKEFLDLKHYNDKVNEYRVFYANHKIISISRNSGQPGFSAEPPEKLPEKYINIPSSYYTIDYAELADGTWKVIEAGDGNVSGLSDNQNMEQYFKALYFAFD